jgi:hypothetical protein
VRTKVSVRVAMFGDHDAGMRILNRIDARMASGGSRIPPVVTSGPAGQPAPAVGSPGAVVPASANSSQASAPVVPAAANSSIPTAPAVPPPANGAVGTSPAVPPPPQDSAPAAGNWRPANR